MKRKNDLGVHGSGTSAITQHILATAMNPSETFLFEAVWFSLEAWKSLLFKM